MIKLKGLVLMVGISIGLSAWAKDPYVDINTTMCNEGEIIYISCALDGDADQHNYVGPVASVCAQKYIAKPWLCAVSLWYSYL